jgi:catechol 2,3-dioxygenase-like lactoylglutathione lyase family enzyme
MLNLIVLYTPQLEACRAFYETLGLYFSAEQHGSGPQHYACQWGELVLELYPNEAACQDKMTLGFRVESLEAVIAGLGQPASIKTNAQGCYLTVLDPDGRKIYLTETEVTPPS